MRAHFGLVVAGSALVVIGTAVSPTIAVTALVTVPVTFVVCFAGVTGPNAANGVTAALLAYVLPAASPGTVSMIPDRLAGWWLASMVGTIAVVAFPTPHAGNMLRAAVTELAGRLADALEAACVARRPSRSWPPRPTLSANCSRRSAQLRFGPPAWRSETRHWLARSSLLEWCAALIARDAASAPHTFVALLSLASQMKDADRAQVIAAIDRANRDATEQLVIGLSEPKQLRELLDLITPDVMSAIERAAERLGLQKTLRQAVQGSANALAVSRRIRDGPTEDPVVPELGQHSETGLKVWRGAVGGIDRAGGGCGGP